MIRHLLTAALLASALATGATAAPQVGTSAAVKGNVFVTSAGAERKAEVREAINLQDRVLTKDASALQILLLDQTTFTVAQNARVTIDRFVYDPDRGTGEVAASVAKGAFRFVSGRIGKANPRASSVSTPAATIGIRGTMLEGVVGQDAVALAQIAGLSGGGAKASLVILRGPGRSGNSIARSGSLVVSNGAGSSSVMQPNFGIYVAGPGSAPSAPFRVSPEMEDYLDFFLRSEPSGPPVNPAVIDNVGEASGAILIQEPVGVPDVPVDLPEDGYTEDGDPEDDFICDSSDCVTFP